MRASRLEGRRVSQLPALAALVAAALSLAACSPHTHAFTWTCEGGGSFTLQFDDKGTAVITAAGRTYVLPQAVAASGSRYADGNVEYWEHQGEATLTGAGNTSWSGCRRRT